MSVEPSEAEHQRARRGKSPVSFDVVIDRLEISRNFGDEFVDSLEWSLMLHPLTLQGHGDKERATESPNYLLVGHLFRSCEEATAQVRANGIIRAYDRDGNPIEPDEMVSGLAYGFAEPTYDACRRAVELQAANMDTSLNLPVGSPPAEIELHIRSEA